MTLSLSYVGIEASDLVAWRDFATLVGLQPVPVDGALCLRMDGLARRFIITEGPADDLSFAGFEASDRDGFDAAVARLDEKGVAWQPGTADGAALRAVDRYVSFSDLQGIRHEIALNCALADTPFAPEHASAGFVTGIEGLGHIAANASDHLACEEFMIAALGGRLSDHIFSPFGDQTVKVSFLHFNPRHHSLAYAQFPVLGAKKIDHIMIEYNDIKDVLKVHARIVERNIPITITLGEHPNDHAVSFYCTTPSGFRFEVAASCIKVDPDTWKTTVYPYFSMWGHQVVNA